MKTAWLYLHNTVTDKQETAFAGCKRTGLIQRRYRSLALRQTTTAAIHNMPKQELEQSLKANK